ncbi:MAG: D-aminoacyl-tRNA deacylase [Fimbriimonadaceae bacterium]
MKSIVQRVSQASVSVDGETVGEIGPGLLVLVAAHKDDTEQNAKKLAERIANLRVFNDTDGKLNLPLVQLSDHRTPHSILAVPNFTVLGDTTQRRPSFVAAATYERGEQLFDDFVTALRSLGVATETGRFGADMKVALTNDGPVTVIVEA